MAQLRAKCFRFARFKGGSLYEKEQKSSFLFVCTDAMLYYRVFDIWKHNDQYKQ